MKRYNTKKSYIKDVVSLNCTKYGNPRYEFTAITDNGEEIRMKTASDAAAGYAVRNFESYTAKETHVINGETFYKDVLHVPQYCTIT